MTFNFCRKVFSIGSGDVQSPLQFYKKGFELTSNGTSPSWRDIILSGNTALTLANAKADGLNYVKLFGGTEQNGTPTPTTPMNIVCNNGVVKYGAIGKNLYNSTTRTDGYYIGENGTIAQGSGTFCYSALIPVKPNTAYVLSGIAGQSDIRRFHAYDSNGNWISQISFASTNVGRIYNITGTTPNNCVYVRISIPMTDTNVQVEQGSTATAYEPYQAGIYTDGTQEVVTDSLGNTASAEILLSVGDYKDTQEVLSGGVTRRIGIKVLDGTEYWTEMGTNIVVKTATSAWGAAVGVGGFCTHLTVLKSGETTFAGSCRFAWDFNVYEYQTAFGVNDGTQFKQFLADQYNAGTPVVIVYPLKTATTETVTGQPLTTQAGTNIVEITQSAIDNLGLEVSYKATV